MIFLRYVIISFGIAGMVLFSGCSSVINSHRQKAPLMNDYLAGHNDEVQRKINKKISSVENSGDEVMWRLEAGAFNFNTGNYSASIEHFQRAEKLIAEYDERAIVSMRDTASEGAMALTNLNALPYRGFCRDRIALSIFKALGYLGNRNEDAFRAQLRRLRDEQKKVMEDYQKFFAAAQAEVQAVKGKNPKAVQDVGESDDAIIKKTNSTEFKEGLTQLKTVANRGYGGFLNPAAIFLSGLGSIRDENYENAQIDFQRLYEAMPDNRLFQKYYVTVLKAANREIPQNLKTIEPFAFPLDRDCVYLIFANGRSAALKQIAIYFPIMTAWPMCEYYPAPYQKLQVVAAGNKYETVLLSNMDGIMAQEFNERLSGIITRIVISTALKEAGSYGATYAVGQANWMAGLAVYLSSVFYRAAFNTADTRSWEILPKEFQLTQFPVPADRKIIIKPDGNSEKTQTVTLPPECRSAIVYVNAPSAEVFSYHVLEMNSK
ncbi:MAG: hypothetical protein PHS31_08740 [Victivallaceae bacterium]|nr:hypothetical protein [Victivallaceae bacterium]